MDVSIIIANYNGEELLKKNLPRVIEAAVYYNQKEAKSTEIIFVDDASSDGSVEYITNKINNLKNTHEKLNIRITLLLNSKNLGFSSTVNRGVKEASGEVVVLLNTDVIPEKDFLEPLVLHFRDSNVFAVGCMDKSMEGKHVVLRGRGIARWERGFLIHSRGEVDRKDTFWVSGGSGAFRKSLWERLQGFDALYNPFYWEDIDLCYRAQKAGYTVLFEKESVVVHQHVEGAIRTHYSPFYIAAISFRNQFIFVWKNITDTGLLTSHVLWLPYHFLKSLVRYDGAFFYGFLLAVFKLPIIIQERWKKKEQWVRRDRDVL